VKTVERDGGRTGGLENGVARNDGSVLLESTDAIGFWSARQLYLGIFQSHATFRRPVMSIPVTAVAVDDDRLARLDPAAERFQAKVDHGVEGPVWQLPLADVADVERHTLWQRILWRDVIGAGDPVPCRVEVPDNVGADETGGTGDGDGERSHAPRRASTVYRLC